VESDQNVTNESDWENRIPCKDESCIGTIGADGRCRECGLSMDTQMADEQAILKEDSRDNASVDDTDEAVEDGDATDDDVEDSAPGEWQERILCRDESCTGTIGSNGRCRVCDAVYSDSEP